MNYVVWGVDLVEEHLYCSIGVQTKPKLNDRPHNQVAEFTVNALASGKLIKLDFLDHIKDRQDILYANYLVDEGAQVTCADEGLPTWIAEMMVTGSNVDDAIEKINKIIKTLKPKIETIQN